MITEDLKVSCIIPIYNTSRFLTRCIDSIIKQTYQNIELILVNDCSTDTSADICNEFLRKYPDKIIFIDKKENEGVDKARFSALEYVFRSNMNGAVMFVDSDDYLSVRSVEELVANMLKTNSDIVQMRMNRVWGIIHKKGRLPLEPQTIEYPNLFESYFVSFFGINILDVNMCSKLYRVKNIFMAKMKPTGFRMGEDLMFNMKLFPTLKRYSVIDYMGYNYRVGGLTSHYNPNLWEDLKKQYHIKRDFAHQYNYTKAYRPLNIELKNILISTLCQRIIYLKEKPSEISVWLKEELDDEDLWKDICIMSRDYNDPVFKYIANKDINSIITVAQKQIHASRWRIRAKKILSVLFK